MSAMPQFKQNALGWVDSFIKGETEQSPKSKEVKRNDTHYFDRCHELELSFVKKVDFSKAIVSIFPDDLIGFDAEQAAEIDWFVNDYLENAQQASFHLRLYASVLVGFDEGDMLELPVGKTIWDAYEYFKDKALEKFPELMGLYLKLKGKIIENREEKASRPPCPSCGSTKIHSQGANFKCSECGRSFSKVYKKDRKPEKPESIRKDGRPACIECGSFRVVSSGKNWRCKVCGRQFRKEKKGRK